MDHPSKEFALILIDPQKGFVEDGYWSRSFAADQSIPILESFHRIALFLRSIPDPQSIPLLISETAFPLPDQQLFEPIAKEISQRKFHSITRAWKPHTNLSICPGVNEWLQEQLNGKRDIIIGGCTITSCVRDSSTQMKKKFPQLKFFVMKNLCGARKDNYIRRCKSCLDRYMLHATPPDSRCITCQSTETSQSPVELAFQQMLDAGVVVID